MSAVSRTYTVMADGGTYGEILPLYPPRGWRARHFPIEIGEQARVNIGLYNGSDERSVIDLTLYDQLGRTYRTTTITLEPRQSSYGLLEQFIASSLVSGIYGLSLKANGHVGIWPYVSTVDNKTGDPTNWW